MHTRRSASRVSSFTRVVNGREQSVTEISDPISGRTERFHKGLDDSEVDDFIHSFPQPQTTMMPPLGLLAMALTSGLGLGGPALPDAIIISAVPETPISMTRKQQPKERAIVEELPSSEPEQPQEYEVEEQEEEEEQVPLRRSAPLMLENKPHYRQQSSDILMAPRMKSRSLTQPPPLQYSHARDPTEEEEEEDTTGILKLLQKNKEIVKEQLSKFQSRQPTAQPSHTLSSAPLDGRSDGRRVPERFISSPGVYNMEEEESLSDLLHRKVSETRLYDAMSRIF